MADWGGKYARHDASEAKFFRQWAQASGLSDFVDRSRLMLTDSAPVVVSYGPDYGVRSGRERLGE